LLARAPNLKVGGPVSPVPTVVAPMVLFTVHTNAIVVTIRISIGDQIVGVGAASKTFAPDGKDPRAATGNISYMGMSTVYCLFSPGRSNGLCIEKN